MNIEPIAYIKTDFKEKFGIPRQSGIVDELCGEIVFEKKFRHPDALRGIEEYSHLWLIFDFSENHTDGFSPTVRPPRLGGNKRVGVFATRSPFRPNNLGLSCVRLLGINSDTKNGATLLVAGADLLSGTPIYDIKPYIPYCDTKPDAKGSFAEELKGYSLTVNYDPSVFEGFPDEKVAALIKCIEQDPAPAYKTESRIYKMSFAGYEIEFEKSGGNATVLRVSLIENK